LSCKHLGRKDKYRHKPSEVNHTKKPTVGFLVFENCCKVVAMIDYMSVEGNGKSGRAFVKARPSQLVADEVTRRSRASRTNCVLRGTLWVTGQPSTVIRNPPTHVGSYGATCAGCAVNWDAPNRGSCISKSLILRIGLLQVVDFHDFSGYFSWLWWRAFAVLLKFLMFGISLYKSLISTIVLDCFKCPCGLARQNRLSRPSSSTCLRRSPCPCHCQFIGMVATLSRRA
jgi:hypothetical protein